MSKRAVPLLLLVLLLTLQLQLWVGRGSVPNVAQLASKLEKQRTSNAQAQVENDRLNAEVHDLKEGLDMVEESARQDLTMLRPNEILVQITQR